MQLQNEDIPAAEVATVPKRSVGISLLAGCVSKAWFILVLLICTPYLVRMLGPDGYGLVGIFLTLQRLSALLDSGLSTTINKEMAYHSGRVAADRIPDMLRTLEVVYWGISLLVFAIIAAGSRWIASEWISNDRLSQRELQSLILLMGLAIAVQLPQSFYSAALAGQERHVTLNLIRIVWQGARFLGAIPVLAWIAATPFVFFQWQLATGVLVTAVTAAAIWISMPGQARSSRFRPSLLREVLGFTAGAGTFTVTAVVISQMDKVILSKQLPNDQFGYYMLAYSIPSVLFVICSPIQTVMFPRLSRHISNNDQAALRDTYHLGSQLTVLAIAPIAITGAFFSRELMDAWLNDPDIADQCCLITSILFCGSGVNCLSAMPHTLQMAHGWTRLANLLNLGSIVVLGPLLIWACSRFGSLGASAIWGLYAVSQLSFQIHLMHGRLLPTDKARWISQQIVPITICAVVGLAARHLLHPGNRIGALACIAITWLLCVGLVLATAPLLRCQVIAVWNAWRRQISPQDANRGAL
jgi:O-antigen/teichoic acid export membrane protein